MTRDITIDSTVSRIESTLSSNLAGEEVVLNLTDGVYYGLNEVGARIWALIEEQRRVRGICDALQEEYSVDRATLESDVLSLLDEMEERGLIEIQSPSSAD